MALARTSLSGGISANTKTIRVASATGFSAGRVIKVNSEIMQLQAVNPDVSTEWTVYRGYGGTTAVAHNTAAPVTVGAGSDWPSPSESQFSGPAPVYSYAAAGAITPAQGIHILGAGSAAAMTLANPSLADDGQRLVIVAGAAQAYTVTVPTAITGVDAGTVATFGGAIGDNVVLIARAGLWVSLSVGNVNIA